MLRARRDGAWTDISTAEVADCVHSTSIGLLELGLQPGDRVAILSENRPEWAYADFAILMACCTDVPIYSTLPAPQIEALLRDSGSIAVMVSNRTQLDKILQIREAVPSLQHIITFEDELEGPGVMSLRRLMNTARTQAAQFPSWRDDALSIKPDDLATIIYTSGTTGDPKGVMLSHGNIASNVTACAHVLDVRDGDESLSFLPLSHIFERTAGHYVMFHIGVTINYARNVDTLAADLLDRAPTVLTAVPRMYEKIYEKVMDKIREGSPRKQRIFQWARTVGEEWTNRRLSGQPIPLGLKLKHRLADRLVFDKVRAGTGGRLRCSISGGAPLNPEIARFFHAAGMPVLEGYGLTETSPVISVNNFQALRIGSVGRPIPGVEVRIAEDGEILTRGPHVMKGYYNKPEATAEVLTPDGWFHTGDIGRLDADGYLYITDRKKDLIVTAGGKNIAPQPIEGRLKTNPLVANAVMLGDRRKFPVLLLVPNFEKLRQWATQEGLSFADDAALVALPAVQTKMELEAKKHLRDLAQFEVPKRFLILPRDFSIERGELTPKLSIRRKMIEKNYQSEITALYNGAET
jgi:long-chain acyl-CoA synthetase